MQCTGGRSCRLIFWDLFYSQLGILALATCYVKFAEVPVQVALVYPSAGLALSPSAELFSNTLTHKSGYSHCLLIDLPCPEPFDTDLEIFYHFLHQLHWTLRTTLADGSIETDKVTVKYHPFCCVPACICSTSQSRRLWNIFLHVLLTVW